MDSSEQRAILEIPHEIRWLIDHGEFSKARRMLEREAARAGSEAAADRFMWEIERMRRIEIDYRLTKDDIVAQCLERLPFATEMDVERWIEEGRFDMRPVNGTPRFIGPSVSNLIFRYPDIRSRLPGPSKGGLSSNIQAIARAWDGAPGADPSWLAPRRFAVRMSLSVDPDALEPGETVRCWLPFPQETAFQDEIRLIRQRPEAKKIAPPDAPHRSVYFETVFRPGEPAEFGIEYTYRAKSRLETIDPVKVCPGAPPEFEPFLREEPPHIVFLPEMEAKVYELTAGDRNPCRRAEAVYRWMCGNFRYSYAREYSTIRNISKYCFAKRYGDCGQLALLYIALCRIAGVPARWESGWMLYPDRLNLHDWCVIYLEPYGWVPVDVNMGMEATQSWDHLPMEDRERIVRFYFGHMHPHRLAANSAHGAPFDPPKRHVRSDTVDFQRGEVETESGNLYYGRFDYNLDVVSRDLA